ncbi:hypothetical protein GCM10023116_13460 [Kistimonas scapharcae]|uniref:Uncharacterized protein n=1 Tax=Kistimonas scapharcae TaxID=1036133 RepID=A0ABP8UZN5_9GAMM
MTYNDALSLIYILTTARTVHDKPAAMPLAEWHTSLVMLHEAGLIHLRPNRTICSPDHVCDAVVDAVAKIAADVLPRL